jgi:hypothetical protein
LARATDCEAFIIQKASDLADNQNVLSLIIAAIAAPFNRLQLWKFLLPIPEYMRLNRAKIAYLTDREVTLSRYCR